MAAVHTVAATSASITANEHLTISAARELRDDGLCFAGIGLLCSQRTWPAARSRRT